MMHNNLRQDATIRLVKAVPIYAMVLAIFGLLSAEVRPATPAWSISLSGNDRYKQHEKERLWVGPAQSVFISNQEIAVSFFVFDATKDEGAQANLVAIFLDISSGNVVKTLQWSTPYRPHNAVPPLDQQWLLPTKDGEFLVYTGDKLFRYGSDFQILQERSVSTKSAVTISPGRNVVLVSELMHVGAFREVALSTADLKTDESFGENDRHSSGISDDGWVLRESSGSQLSARTCTIGGPCMRLSHSEVPNVFFRAPTIVNGNLILLATNTRQAKSRWGYTLVQRTGKMLYRKELDEGKDTPVAHISCALSVPRFAFLTGHDLLTKTGVDSVENVHIFDISQMREIFGLHFEDHEEFRGMPGLQDMQVSSSDYSTPALSPDGTKVAVRRGSTLQIYVVTKM